MAAIKPIEQSGDKWQRRASVAGPDYLAGIESPRTPWLQAAIAGATNYRTAVVAAANAGRFESGIRKAGDEKWRVNARAKGPTRFSEGVSLAVGQWQSGFAPYHQAIAAIRLPDRGPTGAATNIQRTVAINNALRAIKERAGGGRV